MFKNLVLLAAFVLLLPILGCAPVGSRVSSAGAGTPIVQLYPTVPVQPTALRTDAGTLPSATASAVPATATLPPAASVDTTQSPTPLIEATNTVVGNQTLLDWGGYTEMGDGDASKCKFLKVGADNSMQVGYCKQAPQFTTGIRQEMVRDMFAHFAPFTFKTDKDTLTFYGQGQVADPIWQHAILEWVHRTYGEVSAGHGCASCNTVFTWSLGEVPSQAGTCKIVYVLAWGYANAGTVPCKGGDTQQIHSDWLTTSEWEKLNGLTNNGAINPDTVDLEKGSRVPRNDKLTGQLRDWAQTVYERLFAHSVSWQSYRNDEGGFSIQYPSQWKFSELPPQNAGLLKGARIEGDEGGVELYWGTGFGGMCEENGVSKYVKVQGAQGGLQTCYSKASDGVEQWNQISTPNLRPGFQARAWTNDGRATSGELLRKVIATLTFDQP